MLDHQTLAVQSFVQTPEDGPCWWREWQFWLLAALAAMIYLSRIADLPIRGEETRRAMVAWEIVQSGDWIVPHQQQQPFLSRPPVGSWPIVWLTEAGGDLSIVAVRLPSIAATIFITLLIYAYARRFLSRLGALSSGLAFATFVQVLQLGRLAETEAIFTMLSASGFLFWHWGYTCRWPAWKTWCAAYTFIAIATLVKSLQAPVYFCGSVGLYLLWQKDWRFLLTRSHAIGLLLFSAIFAAWEIPFYERLGWSGVQQVWGSDVGIRFESVSLVGIAGHLATFPIQVLACLMPWSILLVAYARPQFRRSLGSAAPMIKFALCAWVIALPTCWFIPNARPRYLMPMYPLAAPMIGLVVQRIFEATSINLAFERRHWRQFANIVGIAAIGGAIFVGIASWIGFANLSAVSQPTWFALAYLGAAVLAATVILRHRQDWSQRAGTISAIAIATMMGLTVSGVAVNSMIAADPHSDRQVAQLRAAAAKRSARQFWKSRHDVQLPLARTHCDQRPNHFPKRRASFLAIVNTSVSIQRRIACRVSRFPGAWKPRFAAIGPPMIRREASS